MTGAETIKLATRGETLDVEFKGESRAPLSDRDLVEAVACMANRAGTENGWVLIGVEDDGTISGARPRHGAATNPNRLSAMIMNQTVPSAACAVEVIPVDDVEVIAISVPPSRTPVGTSAGTYLRRTIGGLGAPECKPLYFHDMATDTSGSQQDYTAQLVPNAAWGDLDPLEIERFRRTIRESRGSGDAKLVGLSDVDIAKALGAVEANHRVTGVTVLGLLLFGKEEAISELLPTHELVSVPGLERHAGRDERLLPLAFGPVHGRAADAIPSAQQRDRVVRGALARRRTRVLRGRVSRGHRQCSHPSRLSAARSGACPVARRPARDRQSGRLPRGSEPQ